jgi:hypothetical protein
MLRTVTARGRVAVLLPLLLIVAVGSLVVGYSLARTGNIPSATIVANDYAFSVPKEMPAGLVAITLVNKGAQIHQANLFRLHPGVTFAQIKSAILANPDQLVKLVDASGGVNSLMPGQSQPVVLTLRAGNYVAVCFDSAPDGMPHAAMGLITPYAVASNRGDGAQPAPPTADGTVSLRDFIITMPANISAGTHTYNVVNTGTQPHEVSLLKLAPGKSIQDIAQYMQNSNSPAPFSFAGGIGALAPGSTGWMTLSLAKDNYIAMCMVPDPSTGKAHFELGMLTQFTVH